MGVDALASALVPHFVPLLDMPVRKVETIQAELGSLSAVLMEGMENAPRGVDASAHATEAIGAFVRDQWPFGDPKPTIHDDPCTVETGSVKSRYAKVVVVNERLTLTGSAEPTPLTPSAPRTPARSAHHSGR